MSKCKLCGMERSDENKVINLLMTTPYGNDVRLTREFIEVIAKAICSQFATSQIEAKKIEKIDKCPYRHCVHDLHCTIQGFKQCIFSFGASDKYKKCDIYKEAIKTVLEAK